MTTSLAFIKKLMSYNFDVTHSITQIADLIRDLCETHMPSIVFLSVYLVGLCQYCNKSYNLTKI